MIKLLRSVLIELVVVAAFVLGAGLLSVAVLTASGGLVPPPGSGVIVLRDGTRLDANSREELASAMREHAGNVASMTSTTDDSGRRRLIWFAALPGFLALFAYAAWTERRKISTWFRVTPKAVLFGVASGGVMVATSTLYERLLESSGAQVSEHSLQQQAIEMFLQQRALFFVLAVIAAPLAEEIYFRGRFFDALTTRWGTAAAVAVTSVVFGVVHLNPILLPVYVLLGALLAGTRIYTGGLVAPIIAHAVNNAAALLLEPMG